MEAVEAARCSCSDRSDGAEAIVERCAQPGRCGRCLDEKSGADASAGRAAAADDADEDKEDEEAVAVMVALAEEVEGMAVCDVLVAAERADRERPAFALVVDGRCVCLCVDAAALALAATFDLATFAVAVELLDFSALAFGGIG